MSLFLIGRELKMFTQHLHTPIFKIFDLILETSPEIILEVISTLSPNLYMTTIR